MKLTQILTAAVLTTVPAATFAQSWQGPYVGADIGTAEIDVDGSLEVDGDGDSFGFFAGYTIQDGALVYGGEVDFDSTDYTIGGGAVTVDSTMRLKGRLGTELGGGFAYGTAGLVQASSDELGDGNGYLFGAGYDFPVSPNITLGAELLGHSFEDYNDSGLDVGVTTLKARVAFNF